MPLSTSRCPRRVSFDLSTSLKKNLEVQLELMSIRLDTILSALHASPVQQIYIKRAITRSLPLNSPDILTRLPRVEHHHPLSLTHTFRPHPILHRYPPLDHPATPEPFHILRTSSRLRA